MSCAAVSSAPFSCVTKVPALVTAWEATVSVTPEASTHNLPPEPCKGSQSPSVPEVLAGEAFRTMPPGERISRFALAVSSFVLAPVPEQLVQEMVPETGTVAASSIVFAPGTARIGAETS
jgi:hypothetical protein